MADTAQSKNFLDKPVARGIALLLAVALGAVLWMNYENDCRRLMAGQQMASPPVVSSSEPAKPANPALQACLDQRVGDVDAMKSEGILNDAQYAAFRARAEELCRQQNPTS